METYTKSPKRIFEAEFPRTVQRSVALAQRRGVGAVEVRREVVMTRLVVLGIIECSPQQDDTIAEMRQ